MDKNTRGIITLFIIVAGSVIAFSLYMSYSSDSRAVTAPQNQPAMAVESGAPSDSTAGPSRTEEAYYGN